MVICDNLHNFKIEYRSSLFLLPLFRLCRTALFFWMQRYSNNAKPIFAKMKECHIGKPDLTTLGSGGLEEEC